MKLARRENERGIRMNKNRNRKNGQQGTASPQEAAERASKLKTQGRKGCKAIRINMAFTPENHEFIRIMAGVTGHTMTEFVNFAIEKYREEHKELYKLAKQIKPEAKDGEALGIANTDASHKELLRIIVGDKCLVLSSRLEELNYEGK